MAVQREAVPPSLDPTLGGLDAPPSDANMPRLFSNPHPSAVHSWGYDCIKWIETTRGVTLRWSQKLVIVRALEVDVGGEFCWRDVVVLQPRRGGKTVILREVAMWRASHAHLFNEPQNILHLSKDLRLSRQTMSSVWPDYCPSHGLEVRRSNGQESVLWPDTSAWRLMTHGGSYGHEAGLLLADEGWALSPQHVEEAMEPCLIDRSMPQIWFFSMAHAEATALLVERRRMAVDPDNRVLLAEWSADPGIDLDDVGEWLGVPPHKSVSVVRDYRLAQRRRPRGFREQWLNMWPDVGSDGQSEWPPGWGAAPVVDGDVPPPGGVGALESSFDRRFFSVSVVVSVGDSSHVWTRRVGSQDEAVAVLVGWDPVRVFVGASLFAHVGMPIETEPMGGKETRLATAMFAEMVRRGLVAHNHDVDMGDQVVVARTAEHESGITLSAKASKGPTDQLRSVMWAFYGRSLPSLVEEAAIW